MLSGTLRNAPKEKGREEQSNDSEIPALWCGVITHPQRSLIRCHRLPQERPALPSLLHTNLPAE